MIALPDGASLPERARAIWAMRFDLRAAFDLATARGRKGLFWWYYLHGFKEMGLSIQADLDNADALNRSYPNLPQHGFWPVTWLMREAWLQTRPARTQKIDRSWAARALGVLRPAAKDMPFKTPDEQASLLRWYFSRGLMERQLGDFLSPDQACAILGSDPVYPALPRLLVMMLEESPDLVARFPDPQDGSFRTWCEEDGYRDWPILAHPLVNIAMPIRANCARPYGVNLIGHAGGRFGLGEDIRMAARTLEQGGIPFVVHNIHPTSNIPVEDDSLSSKLSDNLPYAINLFCMTGMETVSAIIKRGRHILEGRHNIGFWPWELPEWPELWQHAYDFMDEIWAGSRFTSDAYSRSAPIAVVHQPMAVATEESDSLSRPDFDLPIDRFLFAFSFDGLSSFERKNPQSCITAFRHAFPKGTEPVGLVIKGLRGGKHPVWQAIEAEAERDPRIYIISQSLQRGALLDLYRCIDCFVSLHRSEGFGRNIAECMMLGKPVIASAHSGNMDFTTSANAALVPVKLRLLRDGEYPFGNGQMWAEPDVPAAAGLMQKMLEQPRWREAVAAAGYKTVAEQYHPGLVAKTWVAALDQRRCLLEPDILGG